MFYTYWFIPKSGRNQSRIVQLTMQAIFPRDDQGVQIGSFQLDMILMLEEMLRQAAIFLHSFDPS